MLTLGSAIFQQLSSDDDPFDTEDDDDEGEDIIEYQGVSSVYLLCVCQVLPGCFPLAKAVAKAKMDRPQSFPPACF